MKAIICTLVLDPWSNKKESSIFMWVVAKNTIYAISYAIGFDVFCFIVVNCEFLVDSCNLFAHSFGAASRPLLQLRHNENDGVSNHQRFHCLLNCWFRIRSETTSKLHVTGLCARNSSVTGEFPAQKASNAKNVSIWWRHHAFHVFFMVFCFRNFNIFLT